MHICSNHQHRLQNSSLGLSLHSSQCHQPPVLYSEDPSIFIYFILSAQSWPSSLPTACFNNGYYLIWIAIRSSSQTAVNDVCFW